MLGGGVKHLSTVAEPVFVSGVVWIFGDHHPGSEPVAPSTLPVGAVPPIKIRVAIRHKYLREDYMRHRPLLVGQVEVADHV